jgi:uncharacterized RDD family membrane protein YckC
MAEEKGNVYAPTEVRVDDVRAEGDLELASRWARLGGAIVDGLIVGIPSYFIVFVMLEKSFGVAEGTEPGIMASILLTVVYFVLYFTLYSAINWSSLEKTGQSIGKKVASIRIVRSDGSPVGAQRALFLRYLPIQGASMIPILGGLLALINALLIFRESRQCLHDNIADTVVVKA